MNYVKEDMIVRGNKIRLLKGGNGEPLLYLHGAAGGGEWLPCLEALSNDYTIYCPDHPGYGYSDDDKKIDSIHDLAFFYLDFLDQLGIDQVTLIGSSLGGWLALEIAILSPERIKKVVLVNASGIRMEGLPDAFVLSTDKLYNALYHTNDAKNRVQETILNNPEMETIVIRNRISTSHLAWNPYFHDPKIIDRIHRVTMPVMLVWGKEDKLFPVEYGEEYHKLIPHAEFNVIENSGHFPHIEQPNAFMNSVSSFLQKGVTRDGLL
jgi:pimeloyl-ACP methyl ester carboxylesterase